MPTKKPDWRAYLVSPHPSYPPNPEWETTLTQRLNDLEESGCEIFSVYAVGNYTAIITRRAPRRDENAD